MTLANMGQIVFVAFIGPIRASMSWQMSLFGFAVFIALTWLALQFLNIDKQIARVADLESKDLEKRERLVDMATQ